MILAGAIAALALAPEPSEQHAPHAEEEEEAGHHGSFMEDHEGMMPTHWNNLVGLKLIGLAAIPQADPRDTEAQWGIGVLYERTAIPGWLEVEFSGNALLAPDGIHVPLDILFKKPFHVTHIVDPYVGIGPSLTIGFGDERFAAPGLLATGGVYIWFRERVGIMAELDYGIVFERGAWFHEIEATTGAVARF